MGLNEKIEELTEPLVWGEALWPGCRCRLIHDVGGGVRVLWRDCPVHGEEERFTFDKK